MVGGYVSKAEVEGEFVRISCEDTNGDTCDIRVRKNAKARTVSRGDVIWWQNRTAFWTPKMTYSSSSPDIGPTDIKLTKVGNSE